MKLLIIEDDRLLAQAVSYALSREGYEVICAHTYEKGMALFEQEQVDLVLLDVRLEGRSGFDLCGEIRKTSQVPVLFITANDTDEDMVRGFDLGCDDYIPKPFSLEVLKRRIEAVLKRSGKLSGDVLEEGPLRIDYAKKQVTKAGVGIKLTVTEYRLVEVLSKNKGQVLTREKLLEKLWDLDGKFVDENTLSVNIRRLRIKLEDNPKSPKWINTVFGIGYTWGE
ncbi:MAG: response regulator transcription factor [Cellulosilyticaceae bacterium]